MLLLIAAASVLAGFSQFADRAAAAGLHVVTYCGGPTKEHILESTGSGILVVDYDQVGRAHRAWGEDGTIIYGMWGFSPLYRVEASGGTPRPFSALAPGEVDHDYADFLPGGEVVLFSATRSSSGWERAEIVAQSLTTGERKPIVEDAHYAFHTLTGHLVFARGGSLVAAAFDADTLVVRGEPIPVVDEVKQSPFLSGIAQYSVAENGSLLYLRGDLMEPPVEPLWVDRAWVAIWRLRSRRMAPVWPSRFGGRTIEVSGSSGLGTGSRRRLTFDSGGEALFGTWTRDQEWLYYLSSFEGAPRLYRKRTDGSGAAELVVEAPVVPHSMTPDGTLLGWQFGDRTSIDVVVVEPGRNPVARPLLATEWRGAIRRSRRTAFRGHLGPRKSRRGRTHPGGPMLGGRTQSRCGAV